MWGVIDLIGNYGISSTKKFSVQASAESMPAQSTLRSNLTGHDCPLLEVKGPKDCICVLSMHECYSFQTPHLIGTFDGAPMCFMTRDTLNTVPSHIKLRFMRNAESAVHWSNIYAATSAHLDLPPGSNNFACILVGPLDLRLQMFPVGCIAWIESNTELRGEVNINWLNYYFPSSSCSSRRKEPYKDTECIICMDEVALFSWKACNHNRALLCQDCNDKTQILAGQEATMCVLCRAVSVLVMYQS